jgi:membrane protein DedA with SNARE-associated domain
VLGPAAAIAFAQTAARAAESGSQAGCLERLAAVAFDPAWNLEHRFVVFATLLAVLFISGFGVPLPEDIPLPLAGFTTAAQSGGEIEFSRQFTTFLLVLIPILLGDLIAYGMGRRWRLGLRERFGLVRRALPPRRLARVQAWFDRYGAFAVFLGRQVAGLRFVAFFTAGAMRVPLPVFVGFDALGCVVSVPIWLSLGALASRHGQAWLQAASAHASHSILLLVVLLIGVLVLVSKVRNGFHQAEAKETDGGVG